MAITLLKISCGKTAGNTPYLFKDVAGVLNFTDKRWSLKLNLRSASFFGSQSSPLATGCPLLTKLYLSTLWK
jgi:hypothetical protein